MYIEAAIERCFTKEGSPKSCSAKGVLQQSFFAVVKILKKVFESDCNWTRTT